MFAEQVRSFVAKRSTKRMHQACYPQNFHRVERHSATNMVLSGEIDEYGSNLSDTYKAKAKAMFAEQARSLSRSQESSARPTCTTGMCAQACKIQGKIQGSEPGSREPEQGFNDRSLSKCAGASSTTITPPNRAFSTCDWSECVRVHVCRRNSSKWGAKAGNR